MNKKKIVAVVIFIQFLLIISKFHNFILPVHSNPQDRTTCVLNETVDYLEMWLVQDPVAVVGEEVTMTYRIRSHFLDSISVDVFLSDTFTTLYEVYDQPFDYLDVYEVNYSRTFSSEGPYLYYFSAEVDIGLGFEVFYQWEAYNDGTIYLKILHNDGNDTTFEDIENTIYLSATNYYSELKNVSLAVDIEDYMPIERIYEEYVLLDPAEEYSFNVNYTFEDPGDYFTYFYATENDTLTTWYQSRYWEVLGVVPELSLIPYAMVIVLSYLCVLVSKKRRPN